MALHWRCTSVRFSMQHPYTLGVMPAWDGRPRVRGRSVGQSVVSNFSLLFRCAGSLGRRAFQAVGSAKYCHLCEHTLLTHLTTSMKYTCGLYTGINVLPDFWHIIWACGLSTSAAYSRDFTVSMASPVNRWNMCLDIVNVLGRTPVVMNNSQLSVISAAAKACTFRVVAFREQTIIVSYRNRYWMYRIESYHLLMYLWYISRCISILRASLQVR